MFRRWFDRSSKADEDGFYETALPAAVVTAGSLHVLHVGGRKLLVTRVDGQLQAFSHVCPHAAADLSKGRLRGSEIKCPEHGYTFDVRTGRATWPPGEGCHLTRFAVRKEEGTVRIKLEG